MILSSVKPIIIGVDPGTTIGLCILNYKGDVLRLYSKRNVSQAEIIREVLKEGKPIIISTDKKKVPEYIQSIARVLGCKIYTPKEDLKNEEKNGIVKEKGLKEEIKNDHERDACASALFAFKHFKRSIEKIIRETSYEKKLEERERDRLMNRVFEEVFIENKNIKSALRKIGSKIDSKEIKGGKEKEKEEKEKREGNEESLRKKNRDNRKREEEAYQIQLVRIKRQIRALEKNNALLKQKIESLYKEKEIKEREKLKSLSEEIKKVLRNNDAEKRLLRSLLSHAREEIKELKRELEDMKELETELEKLAIDSNLERCWYCKKLTKEAFKSMDLDKNNEIIVEEITTIKRAIIEQLKKKETTLYYLRGNKKLINALKEEGIHIHNADGLKLRIFKNMAFFNKKSKDDIIKRKLVEELINEYRKKRKKILEE